MIARLIFAAQAHFARWLAPRGDTHEIGYLHRNSFEMAIQRSAEFRGAFAFWWTRADQALLAGDLVRVETPEFGPLELIVVRARQTPSHGTSGLAVPSEWSQQAAMEASWKDFRRQAGRELEMLRQAVWGLVAQAPESQALIPYHYFRSQEPVEVELVPGEDGVFVRVTAVEKGEQVRYG